MKILYLPRFYQHEYYKKRYEFDNAWANKLKTKLVHKMGNLRRKIYYSPIDAFFEASLSRAGSVRNVQYKDVKKHTKVGFDAVVVHFRCAPGRLRGEDECLIQIAKNFDCAKALFIDADESEIMKDDRVLDFYDVIFKREPFIDLDRYPIRAANRVKIRPTMLACRYFRHSPFRFAERQRHRGLLDKESSLDCADVFFIGKATSERVAVWHALQDTPGLRLAGGLLPRIGFENQSVQMSSPLNEREFISHIKGSRISLAIGGHGQFTFRHLDVWCSGGFLMANASLRDIWLPMSMREGEHFVCYENVDDLLSMVKYFVTNLKKCREVAENGRRQFKKEYDVHLHGAAIHAALTG